MKNLAIIPARSGSKGLPDKNIKLLQGKPLLSYSVEAAAKAKIFDTIHVSTDSAQYGEIARECGADVPFLRSSETSTDTASSWSVVLEVLSNYELRGITFDTVALLQPTSPLRTAEDICNAYQMMRDKQAEAVVSVCEVDHSPLWCGTLPESRCMDGFLSPEAMAPRQLLNTYYRLNGAIYLISVETLKKQGKLIYNQDCYAYIMPRERSIDIDGKLDFLFAEIAMKT